MPHRVYSLDEPMLSGTYAGVEFRQGTGMIPEGRLGVVAFFTNTAGFEVVVTDEVPEPLRVPVTAEALSFGANAESLNGQYGVYGSGGTGS